MRKRMIVIGILILIFSLAGCRRYIRIPNEDKMTNAKCKEIIAALENQDKKALKKLLSQKALVEGLNFEEGANYLINNYHGTFKSIELLGGLDVGESYDGGKRSKEILARYKVTTDKEIYWLYFNFWPVNTFDSDKEGIDSLYMTTFEEWDKNGFGDWKGDKLGIYFPGWNKENVEDTNE